MSLKNGASAFNLTYSQKSKGHEPDWTKEWSIRIDCLWRRDYTDDFGNRSTVSED